MRPKLPEKTMDLLMTNDVECHSFETNTLHDAIAERVENEAMPKLLELYQQHNVKSTFFFTANFARLSPKTVRTVRDFGHEVGCHGYNHTDYYDVLTYEQQIDLLRKSKEIIEDISGTEVVSFRAPALRINNHTIRALEETGFKYDSSVSPQRFDGPLTSGAANKMSWLFAERKPYYMNYDDPFRSGNSSILEVPVSALLWPFIGTTLRISPMITLAVQKMLMFESRFTRKPLVFLFHPNEALEFTKGKTCRRGSFFSDNIRHALKMKNLGARSLELLEKVFGLGKFDFITVSQVKV